MPIPAENRDEWFSYEDYLSWDDDQRWELIDGKAYLMAAPSPAHQRVSMALSAEIFNYLKGKTCEVFPAPFDVRLDPECSWKAKGNVVQPDISVVCNSEQLDERGCNGAPTLVVEILSPDNPEHDLLRKYNKYKDAGVKEYWIVNPVAGKITICMLQENGNDFEFKKDDTLQSHTFSDLSIPLASIFPNAQDAN